jgi:hypothetical protein
VHDPMGRASVSFKNSKTVVISEALLPANVAALLAQSSSHGGIARVVMVRRKQTLGFARFGRCDF